MKTEYPEKLLIVWPKLSKKLKIKVFGGDEDVLAIPAFAVDAQKENMIEKARNWAKNWGTYRGPSSSGYEEKEVDNSPFSVRVYGYQTRYKGTLVFKVVTDEGFTFDLRSEEALDVMLKEGIAPWGKINAKFMWSRKGAHMRMIREGKVDEQIVKDILV